MRNLFKKSIPVRKKELLLVPGATLAGFLVGHTILWAVMLIMGEKVAGSSYEMGTLIGLMVMAVAAMMCSVSYMGQFNMALSMSQSRKNIITVNLLLSLIRSAASVILLTLLNHWERFACDNFWNVPCESEISMIFKPELILLIILALVVLENLFGALFIKAGTRFIWIVIVVAAWLPALTLNVIDAIKKSPIASNAVVINLVESIKQLGYIKLVAIAAVILAMLFCLPYLILRKERVKI